MPLPGSQGLVLFHGGKRSLGTIIAVDDARYRPTGLKPGEAHGYMVDGAQKDGTGVTNSGKVDAGKGAIYMGAGDLYAAGVYNNGTLKGASISRERITKHETAKMCRAVPGQEGRR